MSADDFEDDQASEVDSDADDLSEEEEKQKKTKKKKKKKKKKKPKGNSRDVSSSSRNLDHDNNLDEHQEEKDIIPVFDQSDASDSNYLDVSASKASRIPKKKKTKTKVESKTGKKKKKGKGKSLVDDEKSRISLEDAIKRISTSDMENPSELFLVSGNSGVGKSYWIESETSRILAKIREEVNNHSDQDEDEDSDDDRCNFFPIVCRGTCEIPPQIPIDSSEKNDNPSSESSLSDGCGISRFPMHAITEALNDLICSLTRINYGSKGRIDTELSTNIGNIYGGKGIWKQRIEDALGASEAAHLAATGLVPELCNLLNLSGSRAFIDKQKLQTTWDWNSPHAFHRSCVAIRDLLRAISESHHPVIMVLHNLHLADKDTYRLLNFLLTGYHWDQSQTNGAGISEAYELKGIETVTTAARLNNFLLIGSHENNSAFQDDMLHLLQLSFSQRQKLSLEENQDISEHSEQAREIKSTEHTRLQSHLTKIHMEPFHRKKVEYLLRSCILEITKDNTEDKNEMIAFDEKIQELVELVFEWTRGNVFYVIQVFELLREEGAITLTSSCKLDIEKAKAQSRRWNNSTAGLIEARIDRLPKGIRFALINASVFRQTYIEFSTQEFFHLLSAAYAEKGRKKKRDEIDFPLQSVSELEDALNRACDLGFMKRCRSRRNYNDPSPRWAFAHTFIRDEAYSLFARKKKQTQMEIYFKLGTKASALAFASTSGEQERGGLSNVDHDAFKFLAADQLAMAEEILYKDCTRVALLLVETAEICISKSAFCSAIRYLTGSIEILERNGLRFAADNHGICVKIYLLLARLHSICGDDIKEIETAFREVLQNGKYLKDKILLHQAEIGISIEQKKNENALKQVLSALETLGENFPPEVDLSETISSQIEKLRDRIKEKDNHSLLHPSHCTDKKTIDLMILLSNLIEVSRLCKNETYEEGATIRMVNLSLMKGFTPQYSMSFAYYGSILMKRSFATNNLSMAKEGYRMGQIGEKMARVKSFNGSNSLCTFQHYISHWRRLYRRSLGQILSIYNSQLESGDYFHIQFTTFTYIQYHLASGHNLTKLDDNLQLFDALYQDYMMENHWMIELPQRFVDNMLGETSDPFVFYGNTMEDHKTRIQSMQNAGEDDAVQMLHFLTLFVSILFHNHELSKSCLEEIIEEKIVSIWKPWLVFFRCYTDIIFLQQSRKKSEKKKLMEAISRERDRLLDWYDNGAINCSVMVSLIDAELMIADYVGKYSVPTIKIKKFYDDAIEVAEEQELGHIEAFCYERASMHFGAAGSEEASAEYIVKAHECYMEWNAIAKVDDVEEKHEAKLRRGRRSSIKMIGENYLKQNSGMQYNPERSIGGGRKNMKRLNIKNIKGVAKTAEKKVKEIAFGKLSGKSPRGEPKAAVQSPLRTPSRRPKLAISVKMSKT